MGAAVVVALNGAPRTPDGVVIPSGSGVVPTSTPAAPAAVPGTTYRDFVFENATIKAPTATKAQSKLWYADGTWWAGMLQPSSNQLHIFRLDWATQRWADTGTLVDERPSADPDFLWDGTHLYVVSAGRAASPRHAARVLRFSFDKAADRYTLDPNFPVTVTLGGTSAAVITVDSKGVVWVAYQADGRVWVNHSLGHDAQWREPYQLPVPGTVVDPNDLASIVSFGPGRIGVMWSNQLNDSVFFSTHVDGAPDDQWSAPETVVDGQGSSDDHINLKTFPLLGGGTGVVAALKTSNDALLNPNGLAPLILLAVREGPDRWAIHQVSRVQDKHSRAIVMVDADARQFYVAATTPANGGTIVYKKAAIDDPVFDSGTGTPLVQSATDIKISNATSTKQFLTKESGLLVLASDNDTGRYLHGVADLGAGLPAADPTDPNRSDLPTPPDPHTPLVLVNTDFEPWPVGSAQGTGWAVRPTDPATSIAIIDDGPGKSLRIAPNRNGTDVRACDDVPVTLDTPVTVKFRIRINTTGINDTTLMSLRGSGGDLGSLRISKRGQFSYFDGTRKVESSVRYARSRWYTVTAVVQQQRRTYDLVVATDSGSVVLRRRGLHWRRSIVPSVREMCIETTSGQPKQRIDLSGAVVTQVPAPNEGPIAPVPGPSGAPPSASPAASGSPATSPSITPSGGPTVPSASVAP
jgi:hypothetical protein